MVSGTISGNKVTGNGGGVSVEKNDTQQGKFKMEGGTISNNTAQYGGGVFVAEDCTFEMTGGTISGNPAGKDGGGVYVNGGTFTMENGTISGNTATGSGGGVYVKSGKFTMNNGSAISENTATGNGGGVFVNSGTLTMENSTISNNTAQYGGGVFVAESCTFGMTTGTISSNSANKDGGGVYVKSGTFAMSSGEISGNRAGNGAGVYLSEDGVLNMTDGTISGNSAQRNGGGVYVNRGSYTTHTGAFNMSGGSVTDNTAAGKGNTVAKPVITQGFGDGVYVYGDLTLGGDVDISGNGSTNVMLDGSKSKIQIGSALTYSKPIGVSHTGDNFTPPRDFTSNYNSVMGTADPTKFFVSENTGIGVSLNTKTNEAMLAKLATVTEAPTAKALTYNEEEQELVSAGTAENGTMQYVVGTDANTAPTEGWNTSIPTATNAGTYHVWYKVVGDESHSDSEAACVTATIAEPEQTPEPVVTAAVAKVARPSAVGASVLESDVFSHR